MDPYAVRNPMGGKTRGVYVFRKCLVFPILSDFNHFYDMFLWFAVKPAFRFSDGGF